MTSSEKERATFDAWLTQVPENSLEKPILVTNIEDVFQYMPVCGNYTNEPVILYFRKEQLLQDELQKILDLFSRSDPSFEISVVRHDEQSLSIGIGDKGRNRSVNFDGEYFGHNHPTHLTLENAAALPRCFVAGLMPSAGDVDGFLKHAESVRNGTRIFSKNGYVFIRSIEGISSRNTEDFRNKYLDLFLGENKFGLESDDAVAKYFRENLGFEIEFHYLSSGGES